jgi:hypothetical protein
MKWYKIRKQNITKNVKQKSVAEHEHIPRIFYPEFGTSSLLKKSSSYLPHYTASNSSRPH